MKRLSLLIAACFVTSTAAIAHDPYYDAPYSGPYVGDGYAEWHPEFRSREARYRHDKRYYHDYDDYRPARRRHHRKHYRGGDYEEEFYVGNCKVEREWESDGSYEEEIDCD